MAHPRKRDKICEELTAAIQTGYKPGSRLPGERDFARNLGIARRTLRFILDDLEQNGMIERSRRGTFVKEQNGFAAPGDEPISVLLPCPDFMTACGRNTLLHCLAIRGAMQAATAAGSRVVTIPVSPVNDPERIDLRQLSSLRRGSRVMMIGAWFKKIFPLLEERGCRVGVIADQNEYPPRENDWFVCSYKTPAQPGVSARFLHQRGARRILYFGSDLACESTGCTFFRQTVEELGILWRPAYFQVFSARLSLEERLGILAELWRRNIFDGLIMEINPFRQISPDVDFYRATGIPKDIPIAVSRNDLLPGWPRNRSTWIREMPFYGAAMDIAHFLLGQIPAKHQILQLRHIPINEYMN